MGVCKLLKKRVRIICLLLVLCLAAAACAPRSASPPAEPEPQEDVLQIELDEPPEPEPEPELPEEPDHDPEPASEPEPPPQQPQAAPQPPPEPPPFTIAPPAEEGTALEAAERWLRQNLDPQAHGGIYIRAHPQPSYITIFKMNVWVVDQGHVSSVTANFPYEFEIVFMPASFSFASGMQLQQQIESLDGAQQNIMWAQLDEYENNLRVTLRDNYDAAFLQSLKGIVDSSGLGDYVRIEEMTHNVNF